MRPTRRPPISRPTRPQSATAPAPMMQHQMRWAKKLLAPTSEADGEHEDEERWPRRGLHVVVQAVGVVEERVDEPLAGHQQVRRVVEVVRVAPRDPVGPAEDRAQTYPEADCGPQRDPRPPEAAGVPPPADHGWPLYVGPSGRRGWVVGVVGHRTPAEWRPDPTEVSTVRWPSGGRVTPWGRGGRTRERGVASTEVVTVSGPIVTRDEPRPAPREGARPAGNPPEPTGLRFVPGLDGCAAWPSSR